MLETIDHWFAEIVTTLSHVLFWKPIPGFLPLILIVMVFGGLFFTFYYGFVNLRLFRHCIQVVRGRYDNPKDKGQISHFQALTSALSGTVGLGNIAGVAVAIGLGGPGAVFWLWVVAFFGMSLKFSSCTFAQLYRRLDTKGRVIGGPMVYLEEGFKSLRPKLAWLGKGLGILYAFLAIFAAACSVNLFQANQTYELLQAEFDLFDERPLLVGLLLSLGAGLVILGGIRRIGETTSKLVPAMCIFYCAACLIILISHAGSLPVVFSDIFAQAFRPEAAFGGFLPVFIQGVRRASFSNEAGIGSAAIAHAAARTDEPVREGAVAMIGPFIDTHLVCTMTALTILATGVHLDPALEGKGALMTSKAFETLHPHMTLALTLASVVFAFSTIITWCYYGQKACEYLWGRWIVTPYRVLYTALIIVAPALPLSRIIDLGDMLLLSMAFPNILGMIFLGKKVRALTRDYIRRLQSGEMKKYI